MPKKILEIPDVIFQQVSSVLTSKADVARRRMVQGFIELAKTNLIEKISFEQLGKYLGIHRSNIVYYYPNREALLQDVFRLVNATSQHYVIKRVQAKIGGNYIEIISAWIDGHFEWLEHHPEHSIIIRYLLYMVSYNKKFKKIYGELREMGAQRFCHFLTLAPSVRSMTARERLRLAKQSQALIAGNLLEFETTQHAFSYEELKKITNREIIGWLNDKGSK